MKKRLLLILMTVILCMGALLSGIVTADVNKQIDVNTTVSGKPAERGFDQYAFTLKSPGKVNLILKHDNLFATDVYWTVELYASDLETKLQAFDSKGTDTSLTAASLGLTQGQYYVKVYARKDCSHKYSDTPYSLRVAYTPSSSWEIEYDSSRKQGNDSQATSTPMKLGVYSNGSVCESKDEDFFKFTLKNRGVIQLGFAHENVFEARNTWSVKLINSKTETVYELLSKGTKTYRTSPKIGLSAGTYYLKVSGVSSYYSDKDYHIRVKFTKSSKWEQEYSEKKHKDNGTMGKADLLKLNKAYRGSLSKKDDVDYFKFTLNARTLLRADFSHPYIAKRSRYWTITLYDYQTNKLKTFSSKGVQKTVSKYWLLNPGTYFVQVSKGKFWSNKNYKLLIH